MLKIYMWTEISQKNKERILNRSMSDIDKQGKYVNAWMKRIKKYGNKAIVSYAKKFDNPKFKLSNLKVTKKDIINAYKKTGANIIKAIKKQISLSKKFHKEQLKNIKKKWQIKTIPGVTVGEMFSPIESVGLYVPAGNAPLPTVMQILAVPAKLAGVKRVAVCFPPCAREYELLVAADLTGVNEIYRLGGVAAVAALAYGTETVKPVLKIVGPGNVFVQTAKKLVFGTAAIDMIAGPSEAVVLADKYANPSFVAADILARAEHDANAAGVLITSSFQLAKRTRQEIKNQFRNLDRKKIIKASLEKYCALIVVKNLREAVNLINKYSPEHLEIMCKNPFKILQKIKNAGSIFLGNFAPVAAGDYASGTNHVLPTGSNVKMFSPISVETFMKKSEFQHLTKKGLKKLYPIISAIGQVEGLSAHINSAKIRL